MEYIKLFDNHSDYIRFVRGLWDTPLIRPNVSHCIEENHVHYEPRTWADEYLTFVALEDNTSFGFVGRSVSNFQLSYSLDNGSTWDILESENTVTIDKNEKVLWKGYVIPTRATLPNNIGTFSSTGSYNAYGNIMSLVYSDDFIWNDALPSNNDEYFSFLFRGSPINNAENLILPATILTKSCYQYMFSGCTSLTTAPELPATMLAEYCYHGMFSGCTSLTTAPELPATTLTKSCYQEMFFNCTSLNYIKAMFTTTPGNTYTQNWVYGVASTGTFIKNSAAMWSETGDNGIPTGWTVQTATE